MGSILRNTDGVSKFAMPREGVVVVTFDDQKTTVSKIVKAFAAGSFTVKGDPVYVPPDAAARQVTTPGKIEPSSQKSPPVATSPSQQGPPPGSSPQSVPGLPRNITSPDASGAMPR
jgi:hypothetical protein